MGTLHKGQLRKEQSVRKFVLATIALATALLATALIVAIPAHSETSNGRMNFLVQLLRQNSGVMEGGIVYWFTNSAGQPVRITYDTNDKGKKFLRIEFAVLEDRPVSAKAPAKKTKLRIIRKFEDIDVDGKLNSFKRSTPFKEDAAALKKLDASLAGMAQQNAYDDAIRDIIRILRKNPPI